MMDSLLEAEVLEVQRRLEKEAQERKDREMALQLARDTFNEQQASSSNTNRKQVLGPDDSLSIVSYWNYSQLHHTINTTYNVKLQKACHDELQRRHEKYQAWKTLHEKRKADRVTLSNAKSDLSGAGPSQVQQTTYTFPGTSNSYKHEPGILDKTDRYFCVPFVRPGHTEDRKGWWYAHFHGQYVARQMELHPDKSPVLLVAGFDDTKMCELNLEETGLTRKMNAEILEHEFLAEWNKHGGPPYISPYLVKFGN